MQLCLIDTKRVRKNCPWFNGHVPPGIINSEEKVNYGGWSCLKKKLSGLLVKLLAVVSSFSPPEWHVVLNRVLFLEAPTGIPSCCPANFKDHPIWLKPVLNCSVVLPCFSHCKQLRWVYRWHSSAWLARTRFVSGTGLGQKWKDWGAGNRLRWLMKTTDS